MKFPAVKRCQSNLRCLSLATSAPRAAFELAQGVNETHSTFLLGVTHAARVARDQCCVLSYPGLSAATSRSIYYAATHQLIVH